MFDGKTERLTGKDGLARAAGLIRGGGTVAFATETVYGLGANALDRAAVAKIFEAKERPGWDPLIVHVCDREMLARVAVLPSRMAADIDALIAAFWPGPLTLLLPRTPAVPDAVTAGRELVGVRMPGHPVALELIRRAGVPVAAPSANRFGHTSPTTAAHVLADLDGRIDAVLDGGATQVGVESTVIGPGDGGGWVMYRPGGVTWDMLDEKFPGLVSAYFVPKDIVGEPESLPSPGVGIRHYAPRARVVLVREVSSAVIRENGLVSAIDDAFNGVDAVGVMLPEGWNASCAQAVFSWGAWSDGEALARRLFAGLRELDDAGVSVIVCPVPEGHGIAAAIRDRLDKAAKSV